MSLQLRLAQLLGAQDVICTREGDSLTTWLPSSYGGAQFAALPVATNALPLASRATPPGAHIPASREVSVVWYEITPVPSGAWTPIT